MLSDGVDPSASGINVGDDEGWTPLQSAVSTGNGAVTEILLKSGEDSSWLSSLNPKVRLPRYSLFEKDVLLDLRKIVYNGIQWKLRSTYISNILFVH